MGTSMIASLRRGRPITLVIAFVLFSAAGAGLLLSPAKAQDAAETERVVLQGTLTDASTGDPLANITFLAENGWDTTYSKDPGDGRAMPAPDYGHERIEVTTGGNGAYSVELRPGWVTVTVDVPGYTVLRANGQIDENTTLNLELRPTDATGAVVTGTVRDAETGAPLADAWVSISRDYHHRCDGDVCYAEDSAGTSESSASSDAESSTKEPFYLWYEPRYQDWASTHTAKDGTFRLEIAPGDVRLSANARDHLQTERAFTLAAGETREVELTLAPIPPNTVTVTGTVVDAETGEPIPYADVQLNNQKWGHWNHTRTDEQGRYELKTKPGYTILTVRAERHYWLPCEEPRAMPVSSDGGEDQATTSIAPGEPYPGPCDERTRERGYFSRVNTFVGAEGATLTYDARLKPAPSPDASFSGWVINATSQEGIPNAWISFHNERTNEWGQARTDEDGSYTIDVRAGYYTIHANADGYYQNALNVELASGEDRQLTVELQPGRTQWGWCCAIYERAVAEDASASAPTSGQQTATAGSDGAADKAPSASGQPQGDGEATFQGRAGGLGPYPGTTSSADPDGDGSDGPAAEAPLPGIIVVLGMVGLAALALRRARR